MFFVTKYVMVKQDHRTGCCPLGQRQIAFCDEKVTFFVIGHGSEPFMDFECYPRIEFDIFLNRIQQIGSALCPEFMDILIGTFDKGFILLMIVQQSDICMLRDAHVMDEMQDRSEVKKGHAEVSGFPQVRGAGIIFLCQFHGTFTSI